MNFVTTFGVFLICLIEQIRSDEGVLVKVEQGWLSGQVLQSAVNKSVSYYSFKGIPYAKPPVGPLRFKDPQPPEPWDGVRNATEHGSMCTQTAQGTDTFVPSGEDCLFLNVYTPKITNDSLMAVLVFIHGGQFKFGSGNSTTYGPDILINNKNIVLVTLNHRLDSLGFLCFHNEDVPGNAGLKDQVFALRWVQANIKNFGGDPNRVTLQGQSAGAAAVSLHVLSPMSRGLFHRAFIMSGVGISDWAYTYYPVNRAFALAQDLGFETRNATEALEFLRNTSALDLINLSTQVLTSEIITNYPTRFVPFVACVEKDYGQERFLIKPPTISLNSGIVNGVQVMIGYTNREAIAMMELNESFMQICNRYLEMFCSREVLEQVNSSRALDMGQEVRDYYYNGKNVNTTNMEEFVNFSSNMSFVYNTHRFINGLPSNVSVYFYKFSFFSNWNYYSNYGIPYNMTGAAHTDDLIYLWYPTFLNRTVEEGTEEYKLISIYSELCANFVKYGNPTPDTSLLGFTWPTFDREKKTFLDAQNTPALGTAADEADVRFWTHILNQAGLFF